MPGTYSKVTTVNTGDTITASERNAEHDNHINNCDFAGLGDYSATVSQMQTTTDPYPGSTESLATDGQGELARLRYLIKQITGEAQWYIDPDTDLTTIVSGALTMSGVKNFTGNIAWTNTSPAAPLHIGSLSGTSHVFAILAARAFSSGATNVHSIADCSTFSGNAGISFASFDTSASTTGSNNYGHIIGYQSAIDHASSGTLTHLYDFGAYADNNGGAVTNRYAFYVGNSAGSGTITNQYGLYVESLTKGSTINYAIFVAGANASVFGGQVIGPTGAVGAPSFTFSGSTSTGFYASATNVIALTTNGVARATFSTTVADVSGFTAILHPSGTVGNPGQSFSAETDCGWFVQGTNAIGGSAGGTEAIRFDANNTAGNTRVHIYDNDNATLERITVGAADSGGAGYKVLRIPN